GRRGVQRRVTAMGGHGDGPAVAPGGRPVPWAVVQRDGMRGSGGDWRADADLGFGGERGNARPAGREAEPGLGLAVAVAVAAPARVVLMMARRAAVNEISLGWTGWPARLPLRAGMAMAVAARAVAR